MSNIAKIMELSRANAGFTGGSFVDAHPEASISEAIQRISAVGYEMILEYANISSQTNDRVLTVMVESAKVNQVADFKDIIDEANQSIKQSISQVWEKLKTWVSSVIAKFSTILTASKQRQKYVSDNSKKFIEAMRSNARETTIKGYPFMELMGKDINMNGLNITSYDSLKQAAGIGGVDMDASVVKSNIANYFAKAIGISSPNGQTGEYGGYLKRELFGADAAADMKLSQFNANTIVNVLTRAKSLRECEQSYRKMARTIDDAQRKAKATAAQGARETEKVAKENPDNVTAAPDNASKEVQLMGTAITEYNNLLAKVFAASYAATRQAWNIFNTALKTIQNAEKAETKQNANQQNKQQQNKTNEAVETADPSKKGKECGKCDGKKNECDEKAVDDTDGMKSAYDESSDLSDDDFDFEV